MAQQHKSKAILNTAASSAVGKMLICCAELEGLETINIVRRPEHAEDLRKLNVGVVFLESDEDLPAKIAAACVRLSCTVAFDCKGGSLTPLIVNAMPTGSHIYLYGELGGDIGPGISAHSLITQHKSLHGFSVFDYTANLSQISLMGLHSKISTYLPSALSTRIASRYALDMSNDAIGSYVRNMSAGKILLMPDPSYQLEDVQPLPFPSPPDYQGPTNPSADVTDVADIELLLAPEALELLAMEDTLQGAVMQPDVVAEVEAPSTASEPPSDIDADAYGMTPELVELLVTVHTMMINAGRVFRRGEHTVEEWVSRFEHCNIGSITQGIVVPKRIWLTFWSEIIRSGYDESVVFAEIQLLLEHLTF